MVALMHNQAHNKVFAADYKNSQTKLTPSQLLLDDCGDILF